MIPSELRTRLDRPVGDIDLVGEGGSRDERAHRIIDFKHCRATAFGALRQIAAGRAPVSEEHFRSVLDRLHSRSAPDAGGSTR